MPSTNDNDNVFINCPFDNEYRSLFEAVVFAVFDCGFVVRCSLEIDDASQVRIDKIKKIIASCRFGFHDLCRTELCSVTHLPRFNMPFELGLFLGAKQFGDAEQKRKVCLICDGEPYRYQKFLSDISGQDIRGHNRDPKKVIALVRNWLATSSKRTNIPGGETITAHFLKFQKTLPKMCSELQYDVKDLTFQDYSTAVSTWLNKTVWTSAKR